MKKLIGIFTVVILSYNFLAAQGVGINESNIAPDAVLDIKSDVLGTLKGLLIPRVSSYELVTTAATPGLLVYDTGLNKFYYYQGGGVWQEVNPLKYKNGGPGVETDLTFQFSDVTNNVGIDVLLPKSKLTVMGNLSIGDNAVAAPVDGAYIKGNVTMKGTVSTDGDMTVNPTGKFVGYGTIPIGGIIMWSGTLNDPILLAEGGWELCDGGTFTHPVTGLMVNVPDLRERFIVGAGGDNLAVTGGAYTVNAAGNNDKNTLTLTENSIPSHNHSVTVSSTNSVHEHVIRIDTGGGGSFGGAYSLGMFSSPFISSGNALTANIRATTKNGANTMTDYTESMDGAHTHTASSGNTGGFGNSSITHENRPPYYAMAFIIRTK